MKKNSLAQIGGLLTLAALTSCAPQQSTAPASAAAPANAPVKDSAAVAGTIQALPICGSQPIHVTLSTGSQVVYQTQVSANGTFELHAAPGAYTLMATNRSNCSTQQQVQLSANQVQQVSIQLTGITPAGVAPSLPSGTTLPGGTSMPGGTYLPSSNGTANYGNCAVGYSGGMHCYPPIGGYYYPCAWGTYGCGTGYYPGGGGGVLGKPNVYFSGKKGTAFQVKVRLPQTSNFLAAVPGHGTEGWSGTLEAPGKLKVASASYGYLFYDIRFDINRFQNQEGVCLERSKVVAYMVNYLKAQGFLADEIKDFQDHWGNRLPPVSKNFCIYPQGNSELDAVAELEVSPRPSKVTRVAFMLVPDSPQLSASAGKFKLKPSKGVEVETRFAQAPGKAPKGTSSKNSRGLASSEDAFEVREWGVGFLVD